MLIAKRIKRLLREAIEEKKIGGYEFSFILGKIRKGDLCDIEWGYEEKLRHKKGETLCPCGKWVQGEHSSYQEMMEFHEGECEYRPQNLMFEITIYKKRLDDYFTLTECVGTDDNDLYEGAKKAVQMIENLCKDTKENI